MILYNEYSKNPLTIKNDKAFLGTFAQ
jgi:hypothetical protein